MSKLALILEALRGGNVPAGERAPATTRRVDGVVQRKPKPYGSSSAFPTGLRGYQLHNQEAAAMGDPHTSYADWKQGQ